MRPHVLGQGLCGVEGGKGGNGGPCGMRQGAMQNCMQPRSARPAWHVAGGT